MKRAGISILEAAAAQERLVVSKRKFVSDVYAALPEGSRGVFHLPALLWLHHLSLQGGVTVRVGFGTGCTPGHTNTGNDEQLILS